MVFGHVPDGFREVACPTCSADVGQRCVRPSGHHVEPHQPRIDLATDEGHIDRVDTRDPGQTGFDDF